MEKHYQQLDIFDEHYPPVLTKCNIQSGKELKEIGMQKAIDSANAKHTDWSNNAYDFLLNYLDTVSCEFLCEDFRLASVGFVSDPPSKRAFGSIMIRAAKNGLIRKVGYGTVHNPTAHSCFASKWEKI